MIIKKRILLIAFGFLFICGVTGTCKANESKPRMSAVTIYSIPMHRLTGRPVNKELLMRMYSQKLSFELSEFKSSKLLSDRVNTLNLVHAKESDGAQVNLRLLCHYTDRSGGGHMIGIGQNPKYVFVDGRVVEADVAWFHNLIKEFGKEGVGTLLK